MNKVKTVGITRCTLVFTTFFTRSSAYGIHSQGFATTLLPEVTAQNRPNRAGATPLLADDPPKRSVGRSRPRKHFASMRFVR